MISIQKLGSLALIPNLLSKTERTFLYPIALVLGGVAFVALMAQVVIPLPWTPVPITGQTFAVTFLSLLYGRRLGFLTICSYVLVGGLGLPVFALGKSGISFGPTIGYLIGMMLASFVVGYLADRGWSQKLWKAYLAGALGSLLTFSCGLIVLSYFVPSSALLAAGLYPFLVGDVLKTFSAAGLATLLNSKKKA